MTTAQDVRGGRARWFAGLWQTAFSAGAESGADLHYAGGWRQLVLARARRLDLACAEVDDVAFPAEDVRELLELARESARRPAGLLAWWNGTLLERSWLALHQAEVLLVQHLAPERAAAWWLAATGVQEKRQVPWERPASARARAKDAVRGKDTSYAIAHSLRRFYDHTDQLYEEARSFRNRLIRLTAIGFVAAALLLVVGAKGWMSVDGETGAVLEGWRQYVLVALFGAVGAYVTSLPALSRAPSRRTPFQLPMHQLTLKLVVGPVFALLGVLAIQGQFVTQAKPFSEFDITVLLWATVFGGGQQALTGVLDRKAETIADATPEAPHVMPPAT